MLSDFKSECWIFKVQISLIYGEYMKVNIVIEKDSHGYYAFCPEMKGCQSQGDSLDEVLSNIKEAIELYLETLSIKEKEICLSKEILTTSFEVSVA